MKGYSVSTSETAQNKNKLIRNTGTTKEGPRGLSGWSLAGEEAVPAAGLGL